MNMVYVLTRPFRQSIRNTEEFVIFSNYRARRRGNIVKYNSG